MRKAVSPIVATVVLIAAAIVVGTMAVVWTSGWVSQRTTEAGTSSCALQTAYGLENIRYTQSTGLIELKLTNTGTETIGNFTIETELLNGTITSVLASNPSAATNVTSGQSVYVSANTTWANQTIRSFKVRNNACKNFFITSDRFTII